tara:strand:+ start:481 stop:1176 length:696 start_codon:yes stop_codon:yes gene_type:complete
MIDEINEYYGLNKSNLHKLFDKVENEIEGRICHSSIILIKILCELKDIKNYLEIGVHNGGSMGLMITNKNSTNLFGIDLFEDMYDINKHYNSEKYNKYQYFKRDNLNIEKTKSNLNKIKSLYKFNPNIVLMQGNSYFNETENIFKETIKSNTLDLLFIDGDHTNEGVKNDFDRYSKYVKQDGYIIFDDYHHEEIKKYCDQLLKNNKDYTLIGMFKSDLTPAIDLLIKKNTE